MHEYFLIKKLAKPNILPKNALESVEPGKKQSLDEFQIAIAKMRSSLNAITMRNFVMSEEDLCALDTKEFKRSLSEKDPPKVIGTINKTEEVKPMKVRFQTVETSSSRESDEVASINKSNLPWNKNLEFRNVTPYFKQRNKEKILKLESYPKQNFGFHPVNLTRSTEDLNLENKLLRPVPILASTSYQDLSDPKLMEESFLEVKSIDDLLLKDIDGIGRQVKMKNISISGMNRSHDYENLKFANQPLRKPLPKPRSFESINSPSKVLQNKKLTYILDPSKDEFILENEDFLTSEIDLRFNQVFEDSFSSDETAEKDSNFFNSLVLDQNSKLKTMLLSACSLVLFCLSPHLIFCRFLLSNDWGKCKNLWKFRE